MPETTLEQEYREEAERLALLSTADQRAVLDLHWKTANDPQLKKRDRQAALERVRALEKLLKKPRKKQK
jgi:hypothetical protein